MFILKGFYQKSEFSEVLITLNIGCSPKQNKSKLINVKKKKLNKIENIDVHLIKKEYINTDLF